MQEKPETQVQSLGDEDPLDEGMTIHSRILAWRILMDREAWWATVQSLAKSRIRLKLLSRQACMNQPYLFSGCPNLVCIQGSESLVIVSDLQLFWTVIN